ncbi:MAG: TIGR02391 family protein [Chloroflexi bacterium]|nr:TIGR02391 family protein [Chloroflexota bacterium]
MSTKMRDFFPPIENTLSLDTEDLGLFVLRHLRALMKSERNLFNLGNYANLSSPDVLECSAGRSDEFSKAIAEAWMWLQREVLLAPHPSPGSNGWVFVTRRGIARADSRDLDIKTYLRLRGNLLPRELLDPVLDKKVRPLFLGGDYDAAVMLAFKEVEVRIREAIKAGQDRVGKDLVLDAFHADDGRLTDKEALAAERQGVQQLFLGSYLAFRNPSAHRYIDWQDPMECAQLILLADYLLRVVERRRKDVTGSEVQRGPADDSGETDGRSLSCGAYIWQRYRSRRFLSPTSMSWGSPGH